MVQHTSRFLCLVFAVVGVASAEESENQTQEGIPKEQEAEIRNLIEQLVLFDREAPDPRKLLEGVEKGELKVEETFPPLPPELTEEENLDYEKRFRGCQNAFQKLTAYKKAAFPILLEHFGDRRQSIAFRNHSLSQSVGDACYWNIYFQLRDFPDHYSSYGYAREGRDGKDHPKPYWQGTPFDEAGGLAEWLDRHKELSYPQMQIKCLQWLLEGEEKIGASDADSYFLNILPLKIRILERRLETGEDVKNELDRIRGVLERRDVSSIPANLLPEKAEQDGAKKPSTAVPE